MPPLYPDYNDPLEGFLRRVANRIALLNQEVQNIPTDRIETHSDPPQSTVPPQEN